LVLPSANRTPFLVSGLKSYKLDTIKKLHIG
jgi:hypothetical protein